MRVWKALNNLPWHKRGPLKAVLFSLGTALVLYPKVWLLPRTVERYADMDSVLDPQHAALAPLADEVRSDLADKADSQAALAVVQKVVYRHVPYAYDWDVWGVMEYLPTVDEVFQKGREDCDGRAVVAASLLRRLGYDASLVTDLLHVWVQTPMGETMSPTGGEKVLIATRTGTRARITPRIGNNLARGLAFGVAAFPLGRELLILAWLCALTIQPRSSFWRRVAGCLVLWIALDTMRRAGIAAARTGALVSTLQVSAGAVLVVAGWLMLAIRAKAGPRRCASERPG